MTLILKRTYFLFFVFALPLAQIGCSKSEKPPVVPVNPPGQMATFANPLQRGADPWVFKKDDTYYYMQTVGNAIRLWKTNSMSKLASATSIVVFSPGLAGTPNSRNIWAPEIHYLDGKWYIYYTAGNGEDVSQRTWVLENSSADPMTGTWIDKGKVSSPQADFWAIDGTIMQLNGNNYFVWCGRPDPTNVVLTQNIYMSKMSNPWTLEGPVARLSTPEYAWEKNGFGVNEAPQSLTGPTGKKFLIYSASYCGTDDYALGMLTLKDGGDPLKSDDWTKSSQPVFSKNPQGNAFGPGHNAFFTSPDGTENWIIYHANSNSGEGCADKRNIRIQKFTFNDTGVPVFGQPVASGMKVNVPSGDK